MDVRTSVGRSRRAEWRVITGGARFQRLDRADTLDTLRAKTREIGERGAGRGAEGEGSSSSRLRRSARESVRVGRLSMYTGRRRGDRGRGGGPCNRRKEPCGNTTSGISPRTGCIFRTRAGSHTRSGSLQLRRSRARSASTLLDDVRLLRGRYAVGGLTRAPLGARTKPATMGSSSRASSGQGERAYPRERVPPSGSPARSFISSGSKSMS